jgi:membrane protein implicated in regulation of membrane protease activity
MNEWFAAFQPFEKVYWIIALIASGIFVVLMILTFVGGEFDDGGDIDSDIDGDTGIHFQFLSFKNLVGFFTIFGWTGIACIGEGLSKGIVILISTICGLLMMAIMASLFYYLGKLNSSGSLKMQNALNQIGEVYLTIGANRSRIGKVHINIQGGLRELEALTDETTDLHQGDIITVTEITGTGILIVTKHTA